MAEHGLMNAVLSSREIQAAQILVGVTAAVFIGGRFLPSRYRHTAGIALTVCYIIGVAIFMVYTFIR